MISLHQLFRVVSRVNGDLASPLKGASANLALKSVHVSRTPSPDRESERARITTSASATSCRAASSGRAESSGGSPGEGVWEESEGSSFSVDSTGAGATPLGNFVGNCSAVQQDEGLSPFGRPLAKDDSSPLLRHGTLCTEDANGFDKEPFFAGGAAAASPLIPKTADENSLRETAALINDDEAVSVCSLGGQSPLLSAGENPLTASGGSENSSPLCAPRRGLLDRSESLLSGSCAPAESVWGPSPSDGLASADAERSARPLRRSRRRLRDSLLENTSPLERRRRPVVFQGVSGAPCAGPPSSQRSRVQLSTPEAASALSDVWSVGGAKVSVFAPAGVPLCVSSAEGPSAIQEATPSSAPAFAGLLSLEGNPPFSAGAGQGAFQRSCEAAVNSMLLSVAYSPPQDNNRGHPFLAKEWEVERHPGVCFSPPKDVWRARITVEGRQFEQQFSVKRHGFDEAKMLAIRWRAHMENYRSAKALPAKALPAGRIQDLALFH